MKVDYLKTLIISIILLPSALLAKDCQKIGFTSLWQFDQTKGEITLLEKNPSKVCNAASEHYQSNFKIEFLNDNIVIHSMKIKWPEVTLHDYKDKDGKFRAIVAHETQTKIIKVPIDLNIINAYKVTYLKDNKVVGQGSIK